MARHNTFGSLGRALIARADEIQANSPLVVREATIGALSAIVTATPADSGRARSNWTVTQRKPAEGVREPYSPGQKLGSGERGNASRAIQQGTAEAQKYRGTSRDGANFITNNLPYITLLERGSSQQAPQGMVRFGIEVARKIVNRNRLLRNP